MNIVSYIEVDGEFINVEDFSGPLRDDFYIEGAIVWTYAGVDLLTVKRWDLVDQLWSYLISGVEQVLSGSEYRCSFPDQPLPICMTPSGSRVIISIGNSSAEMSKQELVGQLSSGARSFFVRMKTIDPRSIDHWECKIDWIDKILLNSAGRMGRTK